MAFNPRNIVGPASATNDSIVRFDTTAGNLAQNSSVTVSDDGYIGLNITTPNEYLTLNGYVSFQEQALDPGVSAGFGKLYVRQSDSHLVFKDDSGSVTDLIAGSGISGSGAASKIAIWDGTSSLTSDTELHYDSGNNYLGINETNPETGLHSTSTGVTATFEVTSLDTNTFVTTQHARHNTSGNMVDGFGSAIGFEIQDAGAGPNEIAQVGGVREGGDTSGALVFYTSLTGSLTEAGRFTRNGQLAVGTQVANELVTIEGVLSLDEVAAPSNTAGYGKIYVSSATNSLHFVDSSGTDTDLIGGTGVTGSGAANKLAIWDGASSITSDTELHYIAASNALGIGETSPEGHLHVSTITDTFTNTAVFERADLGTDTVASAARFKATKNVNMADGLGVAITFQIEDNAAVANNIAEISALRTNSSDTTGDMYFSTYNAGSPAEHLRITYDGLIGVGTSTPNELLTVDGIVSLAEQGLTPPSSTAGFGKLYAKTDGYVYFKNAIGEEYNLTQGTGGGVQGLEQLNYDANIEIDVNPGLPPNKEVFLAGDGYFSTLNLGEGRGAVVRINGDSVDRNLTFPSSWKFLGGDAPGSLSATDTAVLSIVAYGDTDGYVVAAYSTDQSVLPVSGLETLAYAASVDIDFDPNLPNHKTLSLTGNVTFTTSNLDEGRNVLLRINGDTTDRNFTFPAGWVFLGGEGPTSIAAGDKALLSLVSYSTVDTEVIAAYSTENTVVGDGYGVAGYVSYWADSNTQAADTTNQFYWDDTNGRLGIGTDTPSNALEIYKNITGNASIRLFNEDSGSTSTASVFVASDSASGQIAAQSSTFSAATKFGLSAADSFIVRSNSGASAMFIETHSTQPLYLGVNGSTAAGPSLTIESGGNVIWNEAGSNVDFRIEGDTEPNLFFADASTNRIGVGLNSPEQVLHVVGSSGVVPFKAEASVATTATLHTGGYLKATTSSDMVDDFGIALRFSIEDSAAVSNDIALLGAIRDGGDSQGAMLFRTRGSGDANPVERMRITNAGNVLPGADNTQSFGSPSLRWKDGYFVTLHGSAEELTIASLPGSTYSTVQDLQDTVHSAGWVSGGTITDAGSGTIDVAAGAGLIRSSNSTVARVFNFDWAASLGTAIPTDTIRFVGVEYNAGSPQVIIKTSDSWNYNDEFPLGTVTNEDGYMHISNVPQATGDHASLMMQRAYQTTPLARDARLGGLILGETGTRNVTVSAGALWERYVKSTIPAIDTSVDGYFDTFLGGTLDTANATQWDNANYNNSGVKTALAANRYANLWFYIEQDGDLSMVYGTAEYTSAAAAQDESVPSSVPLRFENHAKLIGRIIFQEGGSTAIVIESAFDIDFTTTLSSDHGNLSGLTDPDHPASAIFTSTASFTNVLSGSDTTVQLALDSIDDAIRPAGLETITYAASVGIDFAQSTPVNKTVTLAGDITFTSSNLAAGRSAVVRIVGDGLERSLTFPDGWSFLGGNAPAALAANDIGILSVVSYDTTDDGVIASYATDDTFATDGYGKAGYISYWDDEDTQTFDNVTDFYWDDTNGRLGLGTNSPNQRLHVLDTANTAVQAVVESTSSGNSAGAEFTATSNSASLSLIAFGSANASSVGSFGVSDSAYLMTNPSTPPNKFLLGSRSSSTPLHILTNSVERATFGDSGIVFNEPGNDVDFRVEGDTDPNLFFVDASTDKVGIGTNVPDYLLTVRKDQNATTLAHVRNSTAGTAADASILLESDSAKVQWGVYSGSHSSTGSGGFAVADAFQLVDAGSAPVSRMIIGTNTGTPIHFVENNIERFTVGTGEAVFNDPGNDYDFRVEGDTDTHLLFVDASADTFGVSESAPTSTLHVSGSIASGVNAIATNTVLDDTHHTLFVTTGASTITLTLPTAVSAPGRRYEVKKVDVGAGSVSIDRSGSDTIDGNTSESITVQYESVTLVSDGSSSWFIV